MARGDYSHLQPPQWPLVHPPAHGFHAWRSSLLRLSSQAARSCNVPLSPSTGCVEARWSWQWGDGACPKCLSVGGKKLWPELPQELKFCSSNQLANWQLHYWSAIINWSATRKVINSTPPWRCGTSMTPIKCVQVMRQVVFHLWIFLAFMSSMICPKLLSTLFDIRQLYLGTWLFL